ncbi:HAD hydrolase-like protein [Thermoleptolyngbya sichuanensis A183]|uniref:HAD hydrolase-like protein n=1 Tax=Thermoleptolyngbya sichuanensis A183 TaxID=2737172 RepID=A0A6M8B454_9CYAN|nr:HAD family hydrolase [Thermoleptolyngbya sichuanensis]QKD81634.1 HAD hydrolase-like protein [Thermoleptolyngbya sichuanensis A183]
MSSIQLVVFDMAGTTVKDEQEVEKCFFLAAERTGLEATTDQIVSMMGWAKKRVFQTLWEAQLGAGHPDLSEQIDVSYAAFCSVLEEHYQTHSVSPTEGCLAMFSYLQNQGIAIALNTGFYRKVTDIILNRLGWDVGLNSDYVGGPNSIIQASVTPSEIYNQEGRPAPYMIQKAMYKLGVKDPQAVVVIGDTPSDLAAGINAHACLSLGVTNGTHERSQLAAYPNDGLLDSLMELKGVLVSLEASS